jgi:hypothetical protein
MSRSTRARGSTARHAAPVVSWRQEGEAHRLRVDKVLGVERPVLDGAVAEVRLARDEDYGNLCPTDAADLLDPLDVSWFQSSSHLLGHVVQAIWGVDRERD